MPSKNSNKIKKGLIIQKLNDKTVLFDGDESVLHTLNTAAALIFKKVKAGWDKEKIVAHLVKTYSIKENKAQKDVNFFLEKMKKKKILRF